MRYQLTGRSRTKKSTPGDLADLFENKNEVRSISNLLNTQRTRALFLWTCNERNERAHFSYALS